MPAVTTMPTVSTTAPIVPASTSSAAAAPTTTAAAAAARSGPTFRSALRSHHRRGSIVAIKVRLISFFEIRAAFNSDRSGRRCRFHGSFTATHLRALLLEYCFTRKPDAVAFYRQHLYQHLVAFFQFVANILDPVLGDFTDVQQSIGPRQNLNKRSEIRQARYRPQVRLPNLRRRREVADNLQCLRR